LTKEKNDVSFEDVFKNIVLRDNLDTNRSNSPLRKASDAILIDTENLSLNQLEDEIFQNIRS
jgi:cytidylate kinase